MKFVLRKGREGNRVLYGRFQMGRKTLTTRAVTLEPPFTAEQLETAAGTVRTYRQELLEAVSIGANTPGGE